VSATAAKNSMSATATYQSDVSRTRESEGICRILILHEAFPAYTRAVEVCRRVMEQLAGEVDFDVKSWSFIELTDASCARHAAKTANGADIIMLALQTGGVPDELEHWVKGLPRARSKDDGLLALLVEELDGSPAALEETFLRMNDWASRLGLDFVTMFPDEAAPPANPAPVLRWHTLAPSREVADSPPLDHWGLNE
jgi:hypothetical protein